MAFSQFEFFSESLRRVVSFNILLPNDSPLEFIKDNENYERGVKTLFLLHGYSGNNRDWILESKINEFAIKYNIAVIFPNGDNSFYLDGKGMGSKYGTYVGEELVNYTRRVFGLSNKKEDTYIGGFSMGGFGAIHTALKYNETFSKAFALSSALIINEIKNKDENFSTPIADYYYYESTFGNLNELENSENNPEELIRRLKSENKLIPSIFMACGKEDFLIEPNRAFHKFLVDNDVNVYYQEDDGNHNWEFWNKYLEPSIQWLIN
ncbi:alpha/beta hydrolase-fold protein [Clostridium sp.]|uniref:alpha/beta hydrolase n=1 Tax=Clostridium sp. TaxID=1506 RepID=UPI002905FB92|nr:alpha/beta hydrolase-fold protein [Clostridium sp.]MDU5105952.1 alpha/beta hydrolase-fold protein [Clostridium sp.]